MKKHTLLLLILIFAAQMRAEIPGRILAALRQADFETAVAYFDSTGNINVCDTLLTMSPLMYAAKENNVEFLNYCLSKGAEVNKKTLLGETALIFAVQEGAEESVRILLEKGADVNIKTRIAQTPLLIAAGKSNLNIVKMLVEAGATVDPEGLEATPLHKAVEREYRDNVEYLLDHGADVHRRKAGVLTPLMLACRNGDRETAKILLEAGAEVAAITPLGETAFLFAVNSGNRELVSLLLENEANPAVADSFQTTPLMIAASKGDSAIVDLLLPVVDDKNAKNKKGKMAYHLAEEHGYENIRLKLFPFLPDSLQEDIKRKEAELQAMLARGYDTPPEPQGGVKTIQRRLEYPPKAKENRIEGTLLISVRVDKTGDVRETKILETFNNRDCERAAETAIKQLKWNPGKLKGEPVDAWVDVPVVFELPKEQPQEEGQDKNAGGANQGAAQSGEAGGQSGDK